MHLNASPPPSAAHQCITALYPLPLNSLKDITRKLKCSTAEVRRWHEMGAPIIVTGSGASQRYKAEYNRLFDWLLANGEG